MSDTSKIEWTDATWNPVRGCTKVSPGCAHCYAETFADRFRGVPGHPYEQGFDLRLVPEKLEEPLRWKKPRRVFVNSMSDLFQDGVPDEYIDRVFAVMALCPQHTFQVLTKRAERMRSYMTTDPYLTDRIDDAACEVVGACHANLDAPGRWPLPNVWLGVSVENQRWFNERVWRLAMTPAAVRFLSIEPMLGPVSWNGHTIDIPWAGGEAHGGRSYSPLMDFVHWVIVGGESGHGARPFDLGWARSIVAQCKAAGVPVFMKQLGSKPNYQRPRVTLAAGAGVECEHGYDVCPTCDAGTVPLRSKKGGEMAEWPADLRVRQWPA